MSNKHAKTKQIVRWIALTLLRAAIVILGYLLYALVRTAELALLGLSWVGGFVQVDIAYGTSPESLDMTKRFEDDEISAMADKVLEGETIKEIEQREKISYRQARKIQEAAKNSPTINHVYWSDKIADSRV